MVRGTRLSIFLKQEPERWLPDDQVQSVKELAKTAQHLLEWRGWKGLARAGLQG